MARRIMAAALAGLAIVSINGDRLAGDSVTTTAAGASTTTTNPLRTLLRPVSRLNPTRLYPRRAGAKYQDAEAAARATITIGAIGPSLRVERTAVRPSRALPSRYVPSALGPYQLLGLVDGYVPAVTEPDGDLLRVVVRVSHATDASSLRCIVATADGSVLIPLDPARGEERSTTTTTTAAGIEWAKPFDKTWWFPLGSRHGRVYLTCTDGYPSSFLDFSSDAPPVRAVWGLDV